MNVLPVEVLIYVIEAKLNSDDDGELKSFLFYYYYYFFISFNFIFSVLNLEYLIDNYSDKVTLNIKIITANNTAAGITRNLF